MDALNFLYQPLDSSYDPSFDPTQVLTGAEAVAQATLTALKLFLGEWWENLAVGTPVFQVILAQLGSNNGQAAMKLAIQQRIVQVPYVTGLLNIQTQFAGGQFSFTCVEQTAFGTVTASSLPGAAAVSETQVS